LAAAVGVTGIAVIATRSHEPRHIGVIAVPPPTTTTTVTPGYRVINYHGVHVEAPAAWPVVDGMHTGFCAGPFSDTPTVFLGPQENFPPRCPYVPEALKKARDGVWLQPGDTPSDARPVTTPSGQIVFEETAGPRGPIKQLWYHQTLVEIGIGPDPAVARAIRDSIGFTPGTPDTRAAGVCARIDHPDVMPNPERLTKQLVLEGGDFTLDPPAPTDQPNVSATEAWKASGALKVAFERYRLILTRYSARFPALQHPDGTSTPENQNQLAWVVYSEPVSPTISGCGMWGLEASDAMTGKRIGSSGYAPGP
jgi:hypothetical protein